jgi:hypothetical protein
MSNICRQVSYQLSKSNGGGHDTGMPIGRNTHEPQQTAPLQVHNPMTRKTLSQIHSGMKTNFNGMGVMASLMNKVIKNASSGNQTQLNSSTKLAMAPKQHMPKEIHIGKATTNQFQCTMSANFKCRKMTNVRQQTNIAEPAVNSLPLEFDNL